jgi:hypothetical protein
MKTNLTQSEQFKILWEFFAKHSAEVGARGSDELSPEQKATLAQLASGKADTAVRVKLIPLLRSNRNALTYLGEQIKLMRPGAGKNPRSARSSALRSKKS